MSHPPAHPELPRIDIIINYITLHGTLASKVISGVPSTNPLEPAILAPNCIAWVPMYKIWIQPSSTAISFRDVEVYC